MNPISVFSTCNVQIWFVSFLFPENTHRWLFFSCGLDDGLLPVAIWGLCYFMWFVFCSALWLRMCRSWWWFGWSLLKYIEEPEENNNLGLKSAHTITDKNPTPCQDWTVYDSTNNGSNQIQWNNIIFVYNGVQSCGFVTLLQYWLTSAQL